MKNVNYPTLDLPLYSKQDIELVRMAKACGMDTVSTADAFNPDEAGAFRVVVSIWASVSTCENEYIEPISDDFGEGIEAYGDVYPPDDF